MRLPHGLPWNDATGCFPVRLRVRWLHCDGALVRGRRLVPPTSQVLLQAKLKGDFARGRRLRRQHQGTPAMINGGRSLPDLNQCPSAVFISFYNLWLLYFFISFTTA